MEMITIHFKRNKEENMAPGTEFARGFCAGIGPLQLGVVLVSIGVISIGHLTVLYIIFFIQI